MHVYLDSSVVLRKILGEEGPLVQWKTIKKASSSKLLLVETRRVVDRMRLTGQLDDEGVASFHEELMKIEGSVDIYAISDAVLDAASHAMPTAVGTLDAIHLVTARAIHQADPTLVLATHDQQLGRAARASGIQVCGT